MKPEEWKPPHVAPPRIPWELVFLCVMMGWSLGNLVTIFGQWTTWIPVIASFTWLPVSIVRLRRSKKTLDASTESLKQAELRIFSYRDDEIQVMRRVLIYIGGFCNGMAERVLFLSLSRQELSDDLRRIAKAALTASDPPSLAVRRERENITQAN